MFFLYLKDCPVLALTGTADTKTQEIISKDLVLKQPIKLFVSPNRPNLRFSISKVKKKDMLGNLDWLISVIKEYGINTPKTIIFCDTLYAIANVANYIMMKLGSNAFHPTSSANREDCLLGIMHSTIQKKYKERLLQSLKEFVNRPHFHQDVTFGTWKLKLDDGEEITMPNVIRMLPAQPW